MDQKYFGFHFFGVVEYLHIHNGLTWGWDPSLNMEGKKKIFNGMGNSTQGLGCASQALYHRVISGACFILYFETRSQ